MKVINAEPVLECTLVEFWHQYWSRCQSGNAESIESAEAKLRGESKTRPKFRIPSADAHTEIFFDNREMFCRFANFTLPAQKELLCAVRKALIEQKVSQMVITIPWSKTGFRRLRVRASGEEAGILDFEMI